MGRSLRASPPNMKTLLFALLVALAVAEPEADPEADPWLYYSGLRPYAGYVRPYYNFGYNYGYPYTYGAYYGRKKREAEAEPEADPYLLYSHHYPYTLPLTYTYPVVKAEEAAEPVAETKTAEVKPVVPLTYTYPNYVPTVYNTHLTHPLVYNTHLTGYPYHYPIVPVVNKVETKKVEKREAEAESNPEADPYYYYSAYRPYNAYRPYYAGYSNYYYRPYGVYGYGK